MAAAWQVLARCDARLGAVITARRPLSAAKRAGRPPYEALLSAIAHQQLHWAAARAILGGCARWRGAAAIRHGRTLATPDEPARGRPVTCEDPGRCAMSQPRAGRHRARPGDDAAMDDEAIIERLVAVRGVGRWTAQMLLISALGRPNVMPVGRFRRTPRLSMADGPGRRCRHPGACMALCEALHALPHDARAVPVALRRTRPCERRRRTASKAPPAVAARTGNGCQHAHRPAPEPPPDPSPKAKAKAKGKGRAKAKAKAKAKASLYRRPDRHGIRCATCAAPPAVDAGLTRDVR